MIVDRLSGRYGRRGAFLVILGLAWVAFGASVMLQPPAEPRSWVLHEFTPDGLEAALWVASGLVAVFAGVRRQDNDVLGHVALFVMPFVRIVSFALSWVLWCATTVTTDLGITSGVIGWEGGWYAALVWSLVSLMLRLVAEWPNPTIPIPRPPADAIERF